MLHIVHGRVDRQTPDLASLSVAVVGGQLLCSTGAMMMLVMVMMTVLMKQFSFSLVSSLVSKVLFGIVTRHWCSCLCVLPNITQMLVNQRAGFTRLSFRVSEGQFY